MELSQLIENDPQRNMVDVFAGYNHNVRINNNEFYDMENMTSKYYPTISPRDKRWLKWQDTRDHMTTGILVKDQLIYVDNGKLYIGDTEVDGLTLDAAAKYRHLVSFGAYVIIYPDKKYVNTKDLSDYGDLEASFSTSGTVTYTMCNVEGEPYSAVISASEPSDPENGDYWIDTSQTPHVLKTYAAETSMWVQIPTTYVKISADGIGADFKQYDGVKITGISDSIGQIAEYNYKVSALYDAKHFGESEEQTDYIIIPGFLDQTATQDTPLSVSREMPSMDMIFESGNRLWGCRYGTNLQGEFVNEIYASKLGDFKNFNTFMGLSTDSYAASCGTDGPWTGVVSFNSYPIFFKERYLHKVYGNYPANYQIQVTECRGVQRGAAGSLAIVNEKLFYKSPFGVCVYDGSYPVDISAAFGNDKYCGVDPDTYSEDDVLWSGAHAGGIGHKYYICMRSDFDLEVDDALVPNWGLFVYDDSLNMWHKEEQQFHVAAFYSGPVGPGITYHTLFFIHDNNIYSTEPVSGWTEEQDPVEWSVVTGELGTGIPDKKYIGSLLVRMRVALGSRIRFMMEYDSSGIWTHAAQITGTTLRSFSIPLRPRRCDHFRLRIEGLGEAKIYSIVQEIEQGSEH